jgi:UDP-GlcNAc:undecaprenyl-phosphate/decaprenyl-phosphate GlcNAc-1-phosphate transferase
MITTANLTILFLSIFASITFNGFFRNISRAKNILIDIPEKSRKFHDRATPLTGGISIYIGTLVSALLLIGLTNISLDAEIADNGLLKDSGIYDKNLSRKYEVDNIEYDLLLKKDDKAKSISIEIETENKSSTTVKVEPYGDGEFLVTLPNGQKQKYSYQNGMVSTDVSDLANESKNISPILKSPSNIVIDSVTIGALICGALIIIVMLFDDIYGLRASLRIFFQSVIAYLFILISGESILQLGNLLGDGPIFLGAFSTVFTIFCIVGLMNAFNLVDGLNGICAMLTLVPLSFLILLGSYHSGSLILIGSILGFLAYNLGYLGKKRRVFLGDTGSNLLGFCLAIACIFYSQGYSPAGVVISPVTALWFVAIPVLDCLSVMISRVINGIMPFRPGRDHLHHILLDKGLSSNQILVSYIFASTFLCGFGLMIQEYFISEDYLSFLIFVIFSLCYYVMTRTKLLRNA